VAAVLAEVLVDRPFYDTSGGGLTVSGGEPTQQRTFLRALLDAARSESIHTALETCGQLPAAALDDLVERVDLFLFDLKHLEPARHRSLTGVSGAQIRTNFQSLVTRVAPEALLARVPLVPGANDAVGDIAALVAFLRAAGYAGRVELMPYNRTARQKWEKVGRGADYVDYGTLDPEALERVRGQLQRAGFEPFVNH